MGQEKLNFDFEEPKEKYIPKTISITEKLQEFKNKKDFEIQNLKDKNLERYQFLEDVPNWEEQLKKYELNKLNQEMLKKGTLIYNNGDGAFAEVRNINDRFGKDQNGEPYATYELKPSISPIANGLNTNIFQINIRKFSRDEFEDILDERGNILPSRNEHKLAS